MNATLQCFAHIEKFINFFKYNSQVNNIIDDSNNKKLTPSFKTLIEQLWPDNYLSLKQKYYAPYDFKKKISDMNPLFEGIAANDSKDLVNFIIMTLHEELNKVKVDNNIIINENEVPIDQTNKELVFQFFMKDFTSKNQSIISDLFYAMNCSITECTNCPAKLYNYQIYFFIIFPLEEVRKFKLSNQLNFNNNNMFFNNNNNVMNNNFVFDNNMLINNNMNFLMNNKTVSIYDCFDYDKKINLMSGSNAMYCNNCKQTANCTMQTYLVAGPEILILLLNRGKGKEFDVKIDFFEEINLYNYIEYRDTGFNYTLIGVISHIGESGMSGHFIAYCKDPITNKWNKYNDAIVTEVEDFQNEVINFAMPYLLFYQKVT
jgi:ubiquitin carboxyl-terminal hydrolase 2/21